MGSTVLDPQAHESHAFRGNGGLAVSFGDGNGAVQRLGGLGQHTGGTGVDTNRIGYGIGPVISPFSYTSGSQIKPAIAVCGQDSGGHGFGGDGEGHVVKGVGGSAGGLGHGLDLLQRDFLDAQFA